MKRAPIVLSGTALGLVGVLSVHAAHPASTLATAGSSRTAATTARTATATIATAASTTTTTATAATTTGTSATAKSSTSSGVRTATGQDVSFQYGDLQVKVTMTGSKITDVSLVQLNTNDAHSDQIDQVAIPQLRQEAIAAGSAKIDGVSGASYTSAAYEQSLQAALDKLATGTSS